MAEQRTFVLFALGAACAGVAARCCAIMLRQPRSRAWTSAPRSFSAFHKMSSSRSSTSSRCGKSLIKLVDEDGSGLLTWRTGWVSYAERDVRQGHGALLRVHGRNGHNHGARPQLDKDADRLAVLTNGHFDVAKLQVSKEEFVGWARDRTPSWAL
mmetsp:Transcript_52581/g.133446  ORF Transcript_52581/g.133446 Transcript_52581/m.133446 type:complete len:155 (+) Transcript_52581:48-512(+)